jgi:hypothetical protein
VPKAPEILEDVKLLSEIETFWLLDVAANVATRI